MEKHSCSGHFLDSTTTSSKITSLSQENHSDIGKMHSAKGVILTVRICRFHRQGVHTLGSYTVFVVDNWLLFPGARRKGCLYTAISR